jgi:hypothetical protein
MSPLQQLKSEEEKELIETVSVAPDNELLGNWLAKLTLPGAVSVAPVAWTAKDYVEALRNLRQLESKPGEGKTKEGK